jgi:hypothetical protein
MSLASFDTVLPLPSRRTGVRRRGSAASQRALFLAGIVLATVGGFALTGNEAVSQAAAQAGEDLTRLLRAMAAL